VAEHVEFKPAFNKNATAEKEEEKEVEEVF
jgi:hypothetical protein